MYNIAWYARDAALALFPKIAVKLGQQGLEGSTSYVCHTSLEAKHLHSTYNADSVCVLPECLEANRTYLDLSDKNIRHLETKYDAVPLIRCLWGDLFKLKLPENTNIRNLVGHINFWETFLLENKIDMLVTELPTILSICVAWLVCKKLGVEFIGFNAVPIDGRIAISSSWHWHFDAFEEQFNNQKIIEDSTTYTKSIKYLERMKNRPQRTVDALVYTDGLKRNTLIPVDSIKRVLKNLKRWKETINSEKQYYLIRSLSGRLYDRFTSNINMLMYKVMNLFEKDICPEKERYFLMPLHMLKEWAGYQIFGYGYADQEAFIKQVAYSLPVGYKLYVKEHPVNFGLRSFSSYRRIKKCRQVRLIAPYEDTFKLIRHSEGIVTLGSTVGFEALLMNKPVIIFGEPWYRNLAGVYRADKAEQLAELLQNINKLAILTESEKLRVVYALYDISFDGGRWPYHLNLSEQSIGEFAKAVRHRIEKSKKIKFGVESH